MAPNGRIAGVPVLVVALVLAACASATTKPGAARPARSEQSCVRLESLAGRITPEPDPAAGVRRLRLTFVDRSRSTPAVPGRPAVSCRVLPTEVRTPSDVDRPVPLIVVAHGLDGDPTSLGPLLDAWSAAGYVVVAPTFPTTEKDANGTSLPVENTAQAADISFLIDSLLEPQTAATTKLRDRIDAEHIGVAGMSLGGQTVYGLIANTCCADERVSAAIVMAGVHREYPEGKYEHNRIPVLLEQGDADSGYHNSVEAYPELAAPKWFITLHGSHHSPPFEIPLGDEAPLVRATTTDFWNLYLKGEASAAARIVAVVDGSHGRLGLQRRLR